MFYHVRLAACHDHARPHTAVFVSFRLIRRKIYFFTSVLWKRELHRRERIRARPFATYRARVANATTKVFRTIGSFLFLSLTLSLVLQLSEHSFSFFLSLSFPLFASTDERPQAIWILIEKPGFMLLCDDRDCWREFYYPRAIIRAGYSSGIVLALQAW